jgi:hypothetical protein
MAKKHLEPIANTNTDTMENVFAKLREFGATQDMLDYIADTVRAQRDRYGPLKIGLGMGIDRDATVKNPETKEELQCELIVFHMNISKSDTPEKLENTVVIGFMLKDGKIDQLVNMS